MMGRHPRLGLFSEVEVGALPQRYQETRKAEGRAGRYVLDVRFGSKADIAAPPINVRFTPESGHG